MGCAPLVQVNVGLFADKVGVTTANTLDLRQGVHNFAFSVNIGVEETKNVLELLVLLREYERHFGVLTGEERQSQLYLVQSTDIHLIPPNFVPNNVQRSCSTVQMSVSSLPTA